MAKKENKKYIRRFAKEKFEANDGKKDFIWRYTRISFYVMLFLTILFLIVGSQTVISNTINFILSLIWIISIPFCFATSIIHLAIYKEKLTAIAALSISSLLALAISIGYVLMFA